MLYKSFLKLTGRCGMFAAGLALAGILATQAFASDESAADEDLARFFDPLPAEVISKFKPDGAALKKKYGSAAVTDEFEPLPAPERVIPRITGATLQGTPVIDFQVLNQFGFGVEGLVQGENVEISFTVNKLVIGQNGKTDHWRTYIAVPDEGIPGISAGTFDGGTLEDLGDGNYRFTFDTALADISGVSFNPNLTHRVGMEVRDPVINGEEVEGGDATFDFVPASGATEGIRQRSIVTQESCATCHGEEEFSFHGGPRRSVEYCVTCHQPFKRDAFSGNTLDFAVMIHKIHTGADLNNKPYLFCGFGCENFGAPPDDFSEVLFPQSTQNCVTCHDPDNPETPQADWVANRPTGEACASCHDDLAFDNNGLTNANRNHIGLAQPNSTCSACHSEDGLLISALESHTIETQQAAKRFSYNILDVSNSAEGQSPVVTFSVTDPTNDDAPYDIANDPPFTGPGTRLAMAIAWPNTDFNNVANSSGTAITGRPAGQPISITLADGSGVLPAGVFDNGDGTFTVDTSALPNPLVIPSTTPALGSGTVVIEGHAAADFNVDGVYDDEVPVTSAALPFAINDEQIQPRRQIVDVAKCQDCHGVNDGLALHGGNRTDNVLVCSTCHTANATDLFRRPVDSDGVANAESPDAADFREDRTVDFKYMIHAIHAADMRQDPYVAYAFGGRPVDLSEVTYPRSPAECQACHVGDTYQVPIGEEVLATTLNSGATVTANSFFGASAFAPDNASAADPTDDNNASATAAVCASCHDSDVALSHMSVRSESGFAFGNGFLVNPNPIMDPDTQMLIDMGPQENCAFCHSEDSFVPVSEAHGLDE